MSNQATADSTAEELEVVAATVEALARALELHDYRRGRFGETAAHTARVTRLALLLTEQIAPELTLDPQLAYGVRLHDIGMIGVSNSTLLKPGALTSAEIDEIREHPWLGERIVAPVPAARRPDPPGDRLPPRALGRIRLPAWPARDGDPAGGEDLRRRRRLRRDHERAAVPRCTAARGRARRDPREGRARLRPGRRRGVPRRSSCRQSRTSRTSRTDQFDSVLATTGVAVAPWSFEPSRRRASARAAATVRQVRPAGDCAPA